MNYLYLHGFASGTNSAKTKFFVNKFKQYGIECVAPDLNGDNFTYLLISEQIKNLSKLIDAEQEYTIIGSSLGGMIALNLAEKFDNIKKVLLLAPAFSFTNLWSKNVGDEYMAHWKSQGFLEVPHHEYQKNMLLHYQFVDDLNQSLIDMQFIRQLPVQIFHGLSDEVIPYQGSQSYLQINSSADLALLESDHSLMNNLDKIWADSIEFLKLQD